MPRAYSFSVMVMNASLKGGEREEGGVSVRVTCARSERRCALWQLEGDSKIAMNNQAAAATGGGREERLRGD